MILGIRLGSDSTTIAICSATTTTVEDAGPEVIANEDGDRVIATCVSFAHGRQEPLVGNIAKAQSIRHPHAAIFAFPELLAGVHETDIKAYRARFPMLQMVRKEQEEQEQEEEKEAGKNAAIGFQVTSSEGEEEWISVEEITSIFLTSLVKTAESFSGSPVSSVTITVPLHYGQQQRASLFRVAKEMAKLPVHSLVSEPAAILSGYGLVPSGRVQASVDTAATATSGQTEDVQKRLAQLDLLSQDKNYLLVDIGATSTECAAIALRSGVASVVSDRRDDGLGGKKLDENVMQHFAKEFQRKTKLDVLENRRATAKLRMACEQTKKTLSNSQNAFLSVESMHEGVDFSSSLNRMRFEMLCSEFAQKLLQLVDSTMLEANWKYDQVEEVSNHETGERGEGGREYRRVTFVSCVVDPVGGRLLAYSLLAGGAPSRVPTVQHETPCAGGPVGGGRDRCGQRGPAAGVPSRLRWRRTTEGMVACSLSLQGNR